MIRVISDGTWKLDAGRLFGETPKSVWENWGVVIDRRSRVTLGLNCLLVEIAEKKVLVNTGVGSLLQGNQQLADEYGLVPSRLLKGLKAQGINPKQIDIVILSDLRFIHAGGCIRADRTGAIVPMFSRAEYIVQEDAVAEALGPQTRIAHWYPGVSNIISCLVDRGQMSTIKGDREILPGMFVEETLGFSKGHQIVLIRDGGENVIYLGSLASTLRHLNETACTPAFVQDGDIAIREKGEILAKVVREGWLVVFPWETKTPAGYVNAVRNPEGSGNTIAFRSVDLSPTPRTALVS